MTEDLQNYARKGLEAELVRLDAERERVRALLASLGGASSQVSKASPAKRLHQMSDAGRQAIREAVLRRWARVRAAQAGSSGEARDAKATGKSRPTAASSRGRGMRQVKASGGRKK